jgi:hypothetical protein
MDDRKHFMPAPHPFSPMRDLIAIGFLAGTIQVIDGQKGRLTIRAKSMNFLMSILFAAA